MQSRISALTSSTINMAGVLVISLVGGLSIYMLQGSPYWLLITALSVAMPIIFTVFILTENNRLLLSLFWLETLIIALLYMLVDTSFVNIMGIVWIVQAAELFSKRVTISLLIGSITAFTLSQLYHFSGSNVFDVLFGAAVFGLFQVFALGATQRAMSERQLREETGALNRELIATRELLSQTTAQSERVRIARDLHDILGHHMTALILNLEVANHGAEGKVQEKVQQSLSMAKLLLGDIRTAVGELRQDDVIDLEQSITKLTHGIPNLAVELDFSEAPRINRVELAETLLRCSQEAITNVLRHSRASKCKITLSNSDQVCVLQVEDNGSVGKNIQVGNGIKGMMERVEALGGELNWNSTKEGFRLKAELPLSTDT